jgi:multidrug resistance efflux pump
MRDEQLPDLTDCTEFRQTLLARPPALARGVMILLVTLLVTALLWTALTEADLVVRTVGHVRPVTTPRQVFVDFHGDASGTIPGSIAVAEVRYQQGDVVKEGAVLIRMDTKRLDSEIGKRDLTIQAGEKELARLSEHEKVLFEHYEKSRAEAQAELLQAEREFQRAKSQRTVDIMRAEAELKAAQRKLTRISDLVGRSNAAAMEERDETLGRVEKAKAELENARLEVIDRTDVPRRKLERLEKEYLLKKKELEKDRVTKQGEVDVARNERDKLQLERQQALIRAPITGVVTSKELKIGDIPEPGKPVVEIAELKGFLFEAEVSSEEVGNLSERLPARIKLDAYDYQKYGTLAGTVCFLSPDSKVVEGQRAANYLVKIELEGDEVGRSEFRGQVKLGMAGQAEIVTDRESLLSLLVRRIRQSISLG